jgi:DNA-binding response OmpR family regulator
MKKKKILIIEDEEKILEIVEFYLNKEGYEVYKCLNGKESLDLFNSISVDLIILDLMLPDMSGEEICKSIRKKSNVPIIMLTAKVTEKNILEGFKLGADDYVTKPFSPKQLVARVNAVIRRCTQNDTSKSLVFNNGSLIINTTNHEVFKNNKFVNLTPTEFKLLTTLAKHPKKTFTREELILVILGNDYMGFNRAIDTHIKNLRQKIELNPKEPTYILTVHGVGYKFGGV